MNNLYSKDDLLSMLYNVLKNHSSNFGVYALKGGFVVSRYIAKKGMRYTSDIDMSVPNTLTFEKVAEAVKPFLDRLKCEGQICRYVIKNPKVVENRKCSGKIALYRKVNIEGVPVENQPSSLICNIDISIHDLSYGLMTLSDGMTSFSIERMLSDKISVLYSNYNTLCRRCRDLYDIYLFDKLGLVVNLYDIIRCLKERKVDITKDSYLEEVLCDNDLNKHLSDLLQSLLTDSQRVDIEFVIMNNLSPEIIKKTVVSVLDKLRCCIC